MENISLDTQLITSVLNFFLPVGQWHRTLGMTALPAFEKFDAQEIRAVIYSLSEIGVLQKHEYSERTNALYRLNPEYLRLWRDMLSALMDGQGVLPQISLRTLALLVVIARFTLENNRPPRQVELLYKDENRVNRGLINDYLHSSGLISEVLWGYSTPSDLYKSANLLAEFGLMINRGSRQEPKQLLLTDEGFELYNRLKDHHWSNWPSILNAW